jgi:hypothetical protein
VETDLGVGLDSRIDLVVRSCLKGKEGRRPAVKRLGDIEKSLLRSCGQQSVRRERVQSELGSVGPPASCNRDEPQ